MVSKNYHLLIIDPCFFNSKQSSHDSTVLLQVVDHEVEESTVG
jgi:hypothetical protein